MIFLVIWSILFGLCGWVFAIATLRHNKEILDLMGEILDGWSETIDKYGELINKIKTWGNDTSENASVSPKVEVHTTTAPEETVN